MAFQVRPEHAARSEIGAVVSSVPFATTEAIKQSMDYVSESVGTTHRDSNTTADSNDGVRYENTRPTGESAPEVSEGGMSGGGMMSGEGMSSGGMSAGGMSGDGMSSGGMSSSRNQGLPSAGIAPGAGADYREPSSLEAPGSGTGSRGFESGMSGSGLGESSGSGIGSTGFESGMSSSGYGQSSTSGMENSNAEMGSVPGSSMSGLGSTTSGFGSSVTSGVQALGGEASEMGGGIITTADGRQTYAADGYGGGSMGQYSTDSGLDAGRIAGTVFGQSSTTDNGSDLRDIDATSARGASGLSPDGLGWSGVGSTGLDRSGMESRGTSGPAYPTDTSSSRTDYPTLNNPDVPMDSGNYNSGNYSTGLDSTAPGRDDVNTTDRTAPADYDPNPASTEGSAEVAAENPEMLNKSSDGTTDESAGAAEGGPGKGVPHSSSRENESAIPFAGGERLGERHWGESKRVPE
ncbi:hypothetical protein LTR02_002948 [Friedmanniomyces endolithicus]|nr:hypothetical protein LTR59_003926 [Friedmanniomyces endolithicus]KAK0912344.1 hypothetical protein LTR02_002948 [Friedmanniomyces endolithicus]